MICKFIQQLRVAQLFCFHRYVHIYRYIQRLSDSVGLSTQCNIPRREILINVCGRCNSIYTHCRLSWCWPSRAKREGRGIDCAFHSYTRTHINQNSKIAPRCMPSFILHSHIIQHDNSQVWWPLLLNRANAFLAKCSKPTRLCRQYAVMSEISWLAASVNTRGVCSSWHNPTNVTPRTHTASIIMKPLHY